MNRDDQPAAAARKRGRIFWLTPDRFDVKADKSSWVEMARCLEQAGWEVTVLASRSAGADPIPRDECVEYVDAVDLPLMFRASVLVAMYRWLRGRWRPGDIVIVNPDALWLVPLLKRLGIEFVHLDVRTLPVNVQGIKGRLDWLLFWYLPMVLFGHRPDGYSFITRALQREVERAFAFGRNRSVIWQSGVDLAHFRQSGPLRATERFQVFYHGAISIERGIDKLVEAMTIRPLPFAAELVIVGDGADRVQLEQLARRNGPDPHVRFAGFIPYADVVSAIHGADVCVCPLPDRLEWNVSSPLKVLEYMACGKPMILTPIASHREVVSDGRFVIWTAGFEATDVHDAIVRAWMQHEELTRAAAGARAMLEGRFEWVDQAAKLDRYLLSAHADVESAALGMSGARQ